MELKEQTRLEEVIKLQNAMEAEARNELDVSEFEPTVGDLNLAHLDIPPRSFIFHTDEGFGMNEGFLPAEVPCIIAAPGGCGKTYLLIQAAVAAACGTRWLHAKALKPMQVLYLAGEEDKNEVARRLQSVLKSMGIYKNKKLLELINQNLRLFPRVGKNERLIDDEENPTEVFKKLKFFLEEHPDIKLVILDPASKYMGCETEKDAAKAQNWVDLLWQLSLTEGRPSVLVAHHTRKDSGNKNTILKASEKDKVPDMDLDLIRGSGGLVNGFRWAMLLARREYDDNSERVFLRVVKANYTKRSGILQFDPDKNHGGILKFSGTAIEDRDDNSPPLIVKQNNSDNAEASLLIQKIIKLPRFNAINGLD
jgi:hypothetical protein